jgi:hypothetical protein
VGQGGRIIITTNGGNNWTSQTSGTSEMLLSVHFTNQNTGWTVGSGGTILKTTNGGENWTSQTSGTIEWLWSVHFTDQNTGWVVGNMGIILKTTDGGTGWTPQTSGASNWLCSVHFTNQNTGWAVGRGGKILNTSNGGENWTSQTSGTPNYLYSVHFTDNNTGWVVGEYGTILHTTNGGVTFVEEEEFHEIPTDYQLSNNFPNPFNPSTKIRYSIPQYSNVIIKVFDILGNEIETLVDEERQTGTYEITWYAEQLPSGIYFFRLQALPTGRQAGNFIETKKMVLMK